MKEHDRVAEELLAPLAGEYDPTPEDRRRIREKVRAQVAAAAAASTAQAKTSSVARAVTKLTGVGAAAAIMALGVLAYRRSETDEAPAASLSPSGVLSVSAPFAPTAAAPPSNPLEGAPAVGVESLPSAPLPERASSAIARPQSRGRAGGEDDLARETRLLGEAARASREGDVERALLLLDEHARQFPRGVLADERVVARVLALCRAGRESEARAAARPFLASHAPSPLHRRVSESCAGSEASEPEAP